MSDRAALLLARGAIRSIEGETAPRWRRRGAGDLQTLTAPQPARSRRMWALAIATIAASLAFVLMAWSARDSSFSLELRDGCEELAACSRLEAEAERHLLDCWLVCRREVTDLQRARLLRYKAEERSQVRDHYLRRDAVERAEALAVVQREIDDRERERAARERESEREHERRMELERLRQQHAERALQRERSRRLSYLGLLGPEGRKQRLRRCHARSAVCEPLILELVESTTDAAEQRALAELHERLLGGIEGLPTRPRPPPPERRPSQPEKARAEPQPESHEDPAASPAPSS